MHSNELGNVRCFNLVLIVYRERMYIILVCTFGVHFEYVFV